MIEPPEKGSPARGADPRRPKEVGDQGLFAEDLTLPAAVLKTSALEHNARWMKRFAESQGVSLAPHGKTTMCPKLFDLQLREGAWGLTVATPHQLRVARSFGYKRVVLANQLVGRGAIGWVAEELATHPDFDFYCLVDSAENVEQIVDVIRRSRLSRPLQVLVEMGFQGGRTGCRTADQAVALATLVRRHFPILALRGVEGYEGIIRGVDDSDTVSQVDRFLDTVLECARRCAEQELFSAGEILLSAGGSAFFDRVSAKLANFSWAGRSVRVALRGGCYLIHDHGMFARSFEQIALRSKADGTLSVGLIPALEVWAYVQALPEPGRAIAMLGKRDVSYDDLPVPLKWYRPGHGPAGIALLESTYAVFHLNDQHCYLNVPMDCPWRVGDMVGFGISHPCLTFDKWRVLHVVDDDYQLLSSVRTHF